MTHIESAIREAVEKGGYAAITEEVSDVFAPPVVARLAFLDPLFWQALGKAMGWGGEDWDGGWRKHWHRFIDHLAEGKDAESFFKDL